MTSITTKAMRRKSLKRWSKAYTKCSRLLFMRGTRVLRAAALTTAAEKRFDACMAKKLSPRRRSAKK